MEKQCVFSFINVTRFPQKKAWLKANHVSHDNSRNCLFNDHIHAIVASSDPYGLFAEVISEGRVSLLQWGTPYRL